jgi:hypothetical protein
MVFLFLERCSLKLKLGENEKAAYFEPRSAIWPLREKLIDSPRMRAASCDA